MCALIELARLLSLRDVFQKEIIAPAAIGENQDLSVCYAVNICVAIDLLVLTKTGYGPALSAEDRSTEIAICSIGNGSSKCGF